MHKFIRVVILLAVVVLLLLATAVPALAAPPGGKGTYNVCPVKGPNAVEPFAPPGEPEVSIPNDNPTIGPPVEPGNVFWPEGGGGGG